MVVEQECFGFLIQVHKLVCNSLRSGVGIPELVSGFDPFRDYGCAKNHLANLGRGKPFRQSVVGFFNGFILG
jgi:hypothetical protein